MGGFSVVNIILIYYNWTSRERDLCACEPKLEMRAYLTFCSVVAAVNLVCCWCISGNSKNPIVRWYLTLNTMWPTLRAPKDVSETVAL